MRIIQAQAQKNRLKYLRELVKNIGFEHNIVSTSFDGVILERVGYNTLFNVAIDSDNCFEVYIVEWGMKDGGLEAAYGKKFQTIKDFIEERTATI